MRRLLVAAALAVSVFSAGCGSVTLRRGGPVGHMKDEEVKGPPTYEKRFDFFFFGIGGDPREVDVREICGKYRFPTQVQSIHTFYDRALLLLTLGIYAPRTARVWCE